MNQLYFQNPFWLYAIIGIVPIMLGIFYLGLQSKLKLWKNYGDEELISQYSKKPSFKSNAISYLLWLLASSLIALALASPVLPRAPKRIPVGNVQMVAVFDVSRSMAAKDYMPYFKTPSGKACVYNSNEDCGSRLQMAKYYLLHDIMPNLGNDELSLVTFAGKGYEQAPLTNDFPAEIWILHNWVTLGNAPGYGSYTALGLEQAINEFPKVAKPNTQRVIVYFSDGGFDGSTSALQNDLELMHKLHIKLIVVGVGSKIPSPIPVYDANNHFSGYFAPGGNVITSAYDEQFMQSLASYDNGIYLRVGQHHVDKFQLSSIVSGFKLKPRTTNLYQYPLAFALFLIFMAILLNQKFIFNNLKASIQLSLSKLNTHSTKSEKNHE